MCIRDRTSTTPDHDIKQMAEKDEADKDFFSQDLLKLEVYIYTEILTFMPC